MSINTSYPFACPVMMRLTVTAARMCTSSACVVRGARAAENAGVHHICLTRIRMRLQNSPDMYTSNGQANARSCHAKYSEHTLSGAAVLTSAMIAAPVPERDIELLQAASGCGRRVAGHIAVCEREHVSGCVGRQRLMNTRCAVSKALPTRFPNPVSSCRVVGSKATMARKTGRGVTHQDSERRLLLAARSVCQGSRGLVDCSPEMICRTAAMRAVASMAASVAATAASTLAPYATLVFRRLLLLGPRTYSA